MRRGKRDKRRNESLMLNALLLLYPESSRNSGPNLSAVLTRYRTPIPRELITLVTGAIAGSVLLEMKEEENGVQCPTHSPSVSLRGNSGWIESTISSTYLIGSLKHPSATSLAWQECWRGGDERIVALFRNLYCRFTLHRRPQRTRGQCSDLL